MKRAQGLLIRFIDLGLLLLMAFLAVAELNPVHQVALAGQAQENDATLTLPHFRIVFGGDMRMQVLRLPDGQILCQPHAPSALVACVGEQQAGRFLLTARGEATVQQLVHVLDICEAEGLVCVASPD